MNRKIAFVTNVKEYTGPPAAASLAHAGWDVFCHDNSFISSEALTRYESENPGRYASAAQDAAAFVAEGLARFGRIDALISNDIPKGMTSQLKPKDVKAFFDAGDSLLDFEAYLDSLVTMPVRLMRAALPAMKAARSGSIILVTSGAPLCNPAMGGPHGYTAARAAAHGLVKALASELAPLNIQANAIAPFMVYSQTFFPSDIGVDDPQYAEILNQKVPMRRFGRPEEIGALIALLASGDIGFVSGQIIAFSGAGC